MNETNERNDTIQGQDNPYELAYETLTDRSDWMLNRLDRAIENYIGGLLDGFNYTKISVYAPPNESKPFLPAGSGIYVFFEDRAGLKFVYVGQAKSMVKRLCKHHVKGCSVVCVSMPMKEMAAAEKHLIKQLAPPVNIKLMPHTQSAESAFNLGVYIGRRIAEYAELPY